MKQLRNENSVPCSYGCRTGITCSPSAAQQLFSVSGRHPAAYAASTTSGAFVMRTANSRGRHCKLLPMAAKVLSAIFILLQRDMVYIAEIRHCSTGPHCMSPGIQVVLSMPGVGFRKHAICRQHKCHKCEIVGVIPLDTLILKLLLSLVCLSTEKDKIEFLALLFWLY